MFGCNLIIIQATNGRFRDEVAHGSCLCTSLVIFLWEEICKQEVEPDKEASKTKNLAKNFHR
jgi:hypothetical protein